MKKVLAAVLSLAVCFVLSTSVWAGSGSVTVNSDTAVDVYGPLSGYADLGDEAWGTSVQAVAAWVHPAWLNYVDLDGMWISTSEDVVDPANDSWRWFHHEFPIPCSAYNVDVADVQATSDNAEEFYFNGEFIGSYGEVQGSFVDDMEWADVTNYPVYPEPGINTLDFIVRNYFLNTENPKDNPTGLIYSLTINYEIPEVEWLPPVTHEPFTLKDGTTLPLKFQLFEQDGTLITERKNVILELYGGECYDDTLNGMVASWELGEGVENLRFDEYEYYYIANFKTKDFENLPGKVYAVVRDGCDTNSILDACMPFEISSEKGTNRGNNKKEK